MGPAVVAAIGQGRASAGGISSRSPALLRAVTSCDCQDRQRVGWDRDERVLADINSREVVHVLALRDAHRRGTLRQSRVASREGAPAPVTLQVVPTDRGARDGAVGDQRE